ncbi:hypothetical protein [Reinekea marinisedimentorum]|uniref:hypothetical protein n=1 Tax=Reinekea marinisedimentorum TaxID=230495 RepID=UPI0014048D10|nr:hypothetical protein [Reinekea marinisedimentorum]
MISLTGLMRSMLASFSASRASASLRILISSESELVERNGFSGLTDVGGRWPTTSSSVGISGVLSAILSRL